MKIKLLFMVLIATRLWSQSDLEDKLFFARIREDLLCDQLEFDADAWTYLCKLDTLISKQNSFDLTRVCLEKDNVDCLNIADVYRCLMNDELKNGSLLLSYVVMEDLNSDTNIHQVILKEINHQLYEEGHVMNTMLEHLKKGSCHVFECNLLLDEYYLDPETFAISRESEFKNCCVSLFFVFE